MRRLPRIAVAVALLFVAACAGTTKNPLDELRRSLEQYPEYSIMLDDMRVQGTFVDRFEHRYRIVWAEPARNGNGAAAGDDAELSFHDELLDWQPVPERVYERYQPCLGMTVASKGESPGAGTCYPAGYRYVGDQRYGRWRDDGRGGSFWAFYGQYAFMQHMFYGLGGDPIHRRDWRQYRQERQAGRPWYGTSGQWGTGGTMTRKTNPTFFERQRTRQARSRSSFQDRVDRRLGRSRGSGARSRSGGRGGK